ncbi:MAG: biotin--[acetyl-CoA-carboxylase] ligase [Oscillospiraceae bacterium]|nr:biotin--[acetyl-CoA-carboxylase] ligase [Oscillospiraceae bacterium]
MALKEKVLAYLEANRGASVSGEELAVLFGVSRTAVWKAISALKAEGHLIDAGTNRGYTLALNSDVLTHSGILSYLSSPQDTYCIEVHQTIGSTNQYAKELAAKGAPHGTVIVAASQTQGRGRLGRCFTSPPGGIYFSFLLRPALTAEKGLCFTTAACVGVCNAIEQTTGIIPAIKWVNDIYVNDKKVCGILTEAATNFETGTLEYVIVGIGVNFATPSAYFEGELAEIATSLYPDEPAPFSRNQIAAALIENVGKALQQPESPHIMAAYKQKSFLPGRMVQVCSTSISTDAGRTALVNSIDDAGRLLVTYQDDGSTAALSSGEVRLRLTASKKK